MEHLANSINVTNVFSGDLEDMAKYCNCVKNLFEDIFISKTYRIDSLCMCETAHPENGCVRLRILRMAV